MSEARPAPCLEFRPAIAGRLRRILAPGRVNAELHIRGNRLPIGIASKPGLISLRPMKSHAVLALLLTWVAPSAFAQRDFSNVEIKVIPVAKHIYMLEGSGGNIGVSIGADGNLIVDD